MTYISGICTKKAARKPPYHIVVTLDYSTVPAEPRTLTHLCKWSVSDQAPPFVKGRGWGGNVNTNVVYAQKKAPRKALSLI